VQFCRREQIYLDETTKCRRHQIYRARIWEISKTIDRDRRKLYSFIHVVQYFTQPHTHSHVQQHISIPRRKCECLWKDLRQGVVFVLNLLCSVILLGLKTKYSTFSGLIKQLISILIALRKNLKPPGLIRINTHGARVCDAQM